MGNKPQNSMETVMGTQMPKNIVVTPEGTRDTTKPDDEDDYGLGGYGEDDEGGAVPGGSVDEASWAGMDEKTLNLFFSTLSKEELKEAASAEDGTLSASLQAKLVAFAQNKQRGTLPPPPPLEEKVYKRPDSDDVED